MDEINQEIVLKRLGDSIILNSNSVLKIEQNNVDKILKSETISFEQKKEILEKIKLLQIFSGEYISYSTSPTRAMRERILLDSKNIFDFDDQSDLEEKMKKLDTIMCICRDEVLHPFDSMEKKIQQERHEREVYKKRGRF